MAASLPQLTQKVDVNWRKELLSRVEIMSEFILDIKKQVPKAPVFSEIVSTLQYYYVSSLRAFVALFNSELN